MFGADAEALDGCADVFALGRGDFFERGDFDTRPFSRRLQRRAWGAPSLKATFHEEPVICSSVSAWRARHALDEDGEAAGRGEGGELCVGGKQALAGEQFVDAATQLGLCRGDHTRRDFIHSDFEKKVCHWCFLKTQGLKPRLIFRGHWHD